MKRIKDRIFPVKMYQEFKFSLENSSFHNDDDRKKLLVVMLLMAGITAGCLFLLQDLIAWNRIEIGIDLIIIVLFCAYAILLLKTNQTRLLYRISVGSLAAGLIIATYTDVGQGSKFFLLLIFPQVYHTILGNKEGKKWNFITLLIIIFVINLRTSQLGVNPTPFAVRFIIAYLCISSVAFIQEKIRELYFNKLSRERNELIQLNKEIKELSITDQLTGLYNRAYLEKYFLKELKKAQRFKFDLSIALCDIDHFKEINDQYGHQAGDQVLSHIARTISKSLRKDIDWVARYGGEEFLIVLPNTSGSSAMTAVERIRKLIAEEKISWENTVLSVTASFGVTQGVSEQNPAVSKYDLMIKQADKALYSAKNSGRNTVAFSDDF